MGQVQGSLQNIEIDVAGGSSYKDLVCLRTSSVNSTVDSTTDQTNCGVLTAVGFPQMSLDFDAICEVDPSVSQVSYHDLLSAFASKTLVTVKVENPAVGTVGVGDAYYHQFAGYITSLTLNQSTTEFINFSGTIASTGTIDVTA